MRKTRVLPAPAIDVVSGWTGHVVEREHVVVGGRAHPRSVGSPGGDTRNRRPVTAPSDRVDESRHCALTIVQNNRVDRRAGEGRGIGGRGMSADDERNPGRGAADSGPEGQHVLGLERVHCRDTDEPWTVPQVMFDRTAEAKIDERDVVPARFERGGDVLHAEGFDAKERSETEAFVSRNGTKQQHTH